MSDYEDLGKAMMPYILTGLGLVIALILVSGILIGKYLM